MNKIILGLVGGFWMIWAQPNIGWQLGLVGCVCIAVIGSLGIEFFEGDSI